MNIVYFVHDLNDPAVHRRMRMFHAGGAVVSLVGFHRGAPPAAVDGVVPWPLGRTADARLWQRAVAVLGAALSIPRWRSLFTGADAIVARQLETLVLAALARRLLVPSVPLIFECLDIHRLMGASGLARPHAASGRTPPAGAMPTTARQFAAFRARPFRPRSSAASRRHGRREQSPDLRVRRRPGAGTMRPEAPAGTPWRIGWFGVIRCARSLRLLADLALACPGAVEIVIRGRVATSVLPHFDAVVAATPGLSFGGPYDRARDLPRLYAEVDFAWAIDFYEAGSNSDWLLPNRLYEAGLFGAVPIACQDVATGAWLAERQVGVLLEGDPVQSVETFIRTLDAARFEALQASFAAVPKTAFLYTREDCRALVETLVLHG